MAVSTLSRLLNRLRRVILCSTCAAIALGGSASSVCVAQQVASQWEMTNTSVNVDRSRQRQSMRMVVNTSREITADKNFVQVRVQNPDVLTTLPLAPNRLQISATSTGVTQVDLLGADDSVHSIEIMVLGDVRELEAILRELFPDANLQVYPVQTGCIVSGYVTTAEHVDQVARIAELYYPTVINKVQVTGVFTIQLETQILEVSRTKLRELGVDWAFANGNDVVSQTVGGLITATGTAFAGSGQETFKLGVIENSSTFFAGIRALRRKNLVKVLAEPKLVAVDGRPASFSSGGELPIVVPAGLGQVAVQFREFGTRLDYVAKVRGNGRIWLEVRPYISEVDPSQAVNIAGVEVPGFRTRYLETGVELGAGQTLALGGLLQVKTESVNTGLPILSDLPYLGPLFSTKKVLENEIELLVTVTPNFVGPLDPHQIPNVPPGLASQSPTDSELYWKGYIETPVGTNRSSCEQGPGLILNPYAGSGIEAHLPRASFTPPGPVDYGTPINPTISTTSPASVGQRINSDTARLARQPSPIELPSMTPATSGGYPATMSQGIPSAPVYR